MICNKAVIKPNGLTMNHEERMKDLTIAKVTAEVEKLVEEGINYRKKNRWFELTIGVALFAAGIAFAKLFI